MELQPPSEGNIKGATYGTDVRTNKNGTAKAHYGIDFYGAVGTKIYALFEGVVVAPLVTGQPDRGSDVKYPADYTGDTDDAGNRIYVQSTVNGQTIKLGYWHLRTATPVGTHPETGVAYAVGDTIRAGAIVGYVGITGNASSDRPHLHLCARNAAGSWINPDTYINATISTTSVSITIAASSQCNCN